MYRSDPGGNFQSDVHRRVMANLANPDEDHLSVEELRSRIDRDDFLNIDDDEVLEVLQDLEADGDVTQSDGSWKNTEAGFAVLTGDNADNGGREYNG